nr:LysR family transcriptional regulator [Burkholderia sp. WSM2232]
MDRLEAMSFLILAVEHGSLSAAARSSRVPLATLSRKISDLEALIGSRLLVRSTRKLTLTDAGIAYLEAARRILDQVEEAERQASGEFTAPKGELVITAPLMFGRLHVLPIVADFLATFPAITVKLVLIDRNVDLVGDHVDVAIRIGRLPDSSMFATPIGVMRMVTAASPRFLKSHGTPKRPEDLSAIPCVTVDTPQPFPAWRLKSGTRTATVDVPILARLVVSTASAASEAAVRGVGVTQLLHYQVFDAVEASDLQLILEEFEPDAAPVHLLHASRGHMPLKLRRFLDFATPLFRERLAHIAAARPAVGPDGSGLAGAS